MKVSRRALIAGAVGLLASPAAAFWQSRDSNYNLAISAGPPPAGITLVGVANSTTTTVTIPAHLAGDLILIQAARGNSTGAATLPNGFVNANSNSRSGTPAESQRIGWKIATSTSDTSGTWTNATNLECRVYRPPSGYTLIVGASAVSSSTTGTISYPALTLSDTSGNSWVVGFAAASNLTQTLSAPSGMSNGDTSTGTSFQSFGCDTNGGVSSWSVQTISTGTGNSVSATVEIVALPKASSNLGNIYQVQAFHTLKSSAGISNTSFKLPLPNASAAGNRYVLFFNSPNGIAVSGVADVDGNTWPGTATAHANAGTGNVDTFLYDLPNVVGNTTPNVVTITFGAAVNEFSATLIELYGVSTSIGNNGTTTSAFASGPSLAAGSFTPSASNSLILTHFSKADYGTGAKFPASFVAAQNFTPLQMDISDIFADALPRMTQAYVQSTAAAINPSATALGDTDQYNGIAIAIPLSAGSGAAPSGTIQPEIIHHFSAGNIPSAATWVLQCPCTGNLRVLFSDDPNINFSTIKVTDSEGNSYTPDGLSAGFFYFPNSSANSNLQVYVTGYGGSSQASFRFADIHNAATSPFDSAGAIADAATGTTYTPSVKPSPSNTNGLVIWNVGLGQGPGLSVTAPSGAVWDLCTYRPGETDFDTMENADITAHYHNTASGTITATFTCVNNTSSSGGFICFKA